MTAPFRFTPDQIRKLRKASFRNEDAAKALADIGGGMDMTAFRKRCKTTLGITFKHPFSAHDGTSKLVLNGKKR